jgi:hypothetical protein
MDKRIDKPSDTEFAEAIIKNIPSLDRDYVKVAGAAYVLSRVNNGIKKR